MPSKFPYHPFKYTVAGAGGMSCIVDRVRRDLHNRKAEHLKNTGNYHRQPFLTVVFSPEGHGLFMKEISKYEMFDMGTGFFRFKTYMGATLHVQRQPEDYRVVER